MIVDRLYKSIEEKGHVCLGLDTAYEYVPQNIQDKFHTKGEAIFEFNKQIIDATHDVVATFKVQIAYYEALGMEGLEAYRKTLKYIREKGNLVIADVKRGDIAKTAEMYADAHFSGDFECDFMTINAYMGLDTIEPFMSYIQNKEKGLFALVRTSNPGAKDFEYIENNEGTPLYSSVGTTIQELGEKCMGECGYSSIGGVVGCTHVDEGKQMREELNKMFFLIPGYGAQGGGAKDVAVYLKDGNGGVVNSSRGILLAYKKQENGEERIGECARAATIEMRDSILEALK